MTEYSSEQITNAIRVGQEHLAAAQLFTFPVKTAAEAAEATDRTLNLSVVRQGNRVAISVRDHGPGISDRERWRLFRPFCKSATDAAHSAPGVGLNCGPILNRTEVSLPHQPEKRGRSVRAWRSCTKQPATAPGPEFMYL